LTSSASSPLSARAPLAVALDAPDLATVQRWAAAVAGRVTALKVGLEVFCRDGHAAVVAARAADPGAALFLDLKLHDIPATVAGAARAVAALAPDYLTVHAAGGPEMVAAAAEALPATRIAAVTVLTSLDDRSLEEIGLAGPTSAAVVRLARLAVDAGARALVCSPREVALVRAAVGPDVTLITPGVRSADGEAGDQRRIATPAQAVTDGSDLLVIGRPITGAADPAGAVAAIAAEIASARVPAGA
jgi:orotidine-5'-phosphate decarboxylase